MNHDNIASYDRIGLAANTSLRRGPGSPLAKLVRELDPYLRAREPHLYVLEGTYRTLLECGLLLDYKNLHCLPSGRLGGLVDLGAAVVGKDVAGLGNFEHPEAVEAIFPELATELDCVVYLIDPYDPTSTLPDTLAIKRECVLGQKPFLATYTTAREWFTLLWDQEIDLTGRPSFILDEELQERLHNAKPSCIRPLDQQGVALIAHDGKKQDMLEYAADQLSFLSQFRTRLSTGTTGALLNGKAETTRLKGEYEDAKAWIELFAAQQVGCPRDLEKRYRELSGLLGADSTDSAYLRLRDQLEVGAHRHSGPPWVEALNSGPEGGDLQVGEAILMGLCENVLFFEDPTVPHEHEVDIQLFERAARIPNQPARARLYQDGVMCLHDKKSATTWAQIRSAATSRRRGGYVPMTLVTAFRRIFNVELVLATVPGSPTTSELESPGVEASAGAEWQAIAEAAAWYLAAEITSRRESTQAQDGPAEPLRVTIMRGQGVRDVVSAVTNTVGPAIVKAAMGYDKLLEGQLRRIRDFGGLSDHDRSVLRLIAKRKCLSQSYYRRDDAGRRDVTPASWAVQEVCVAPVIGRAGAGAPLLEGYPLARELAHVFRGSAVELGAEAYVLQAQKEPETTSGPAVQEHWSKTDVLLLSCDTAHEAGSRQLPYPRAVCDEMAQRGAVAEVGGIFLAKNEERFEEMFPRDYERQGMTGGQMRRVAMGEDSRVSILVAGAQNRRLDSVFATLEFGLVSTLVTDLEFARELLRLYEASHGRRARENAAEDAPNRPDSDIST